jgi:hypothetical protein
MADTIWQHLRWDLLVLDKEDQPVLAVIVKAMPSAIPMAIEWLNRTESEMPETGPPLPYWMLVDLDRITIFSMQDIHQARLRIDSDKRATLVPQPIFDQSTESILGQFEPEFGKKRIFHDYLLALVQAWLWDFTHEWRTAKASALRDLIEIGLAERLTGGTIEREVSIADLDSLRRNQLRDESLSWSGYLD